MIEQPELTDRAEAVLWVINGSIPGASVDQQDGRDILVTRSGVGVDTKKLATDIATFLDTLDERKAREYSLTPSEYYCPQCGCPVNEHDEHGTCHALDIPELGIVDDCHCPGLSVT